MRTVTALQNAAVERVGSDEFGDRSYVEGLVRLRDALVTEAKLNATGEAAMEAVITDLLVNRLEVEKWYRDHPDIGGEQIVRPLVGLGLPRTGSTALACLLAEDVQARSLRTWETVKPCPPPGSDPHSARDRLAGTEKVMERRAALFPRMTAMLPSTATSPTECQYFMGYDFKTQLFQAFAHIPSYVRWLMYDADLKPTYEYVRRVLKLLQWQSPARPWRIKNPSHSLFIESFDAVFPDARYVMTHRDPVEVVPSQADLYYELQRAYSDSVDLLAIGDNALDSCSLGMERMIAFRRASNDDRFFDVGFATLMRDPIATIRNLYDWLDEPLTEDAIAGMERWRKEKPAGTPYQRTDMRAFGLDVGRIRTRLASYASEFPTLVVS